MSKIEILLNYFLDKNPKSSHFLKKCISILVHFQNQEDVSRGVELSSNFAKVGMLIAGKFQRNKWCIFHETAA